MKRWHVGVAVAVWVLAVLLISREWWSAYARAAFSSNPGPLPATVRH